MSEERAAASSRRSWSVPAAGYGSRRRRFARRGSTTARRIVASTESVELHAVDGREAAPASSRRLGSTGAPGLIARGSRCLAELRRAGRSRRESTRRSCPGELVGRGRPVGLRESRRSSRCSPGIDVPDEGEVVLGDVVVSALDRDARAALRRDHDRRRRPGAGPLGLPHRARERRARPRAPRRRRRRRRSERAAEALAAVGLAAARRAARRLFSRPGSASALPSRVPSPPGRPSSSPTSRRRGSTPPRPSRSAALLAELAHEHRHDGRLRDTRPAAHRTGGSGGAAARDRSSSIGVMASATVNVSGVRCERCIGRLAVALRDHDGIEYANANSHGRGHALVGRGQDLQGRDRGGAPALRIPGDSSRDSSRAGIALRIGSFQAPVQRSGTVRR